MYVPGPQSRQIINYWLPALVGGLVALFVFLIAGKTPVVRAAGLACVIVGVIITLRRLGAVLALLGGFLLLISPAFWSQTGGGSSRPATIVIALIVAGIVTGLVAWFSRYPQIGVGLGVVLFIALLFSGIGTPRSLRLTSLLSAWLLYLLINMLRLTNPRPEEPPPGQPTTLHTSGILLMVTIGVINDPLFTLFVPAIVLGIILAGSRFPLWYWAILMLMTGVGIRGMIIEYVDPAGPLIVFGGWRDATRWIDLFALVIEQYSLLGVILGVVGLARLARWHPEVGMVTMVAYAAFVLFGLVYTGGNRDVLLLPLLIIQIIWIIYALYAAGQWLQKSRQAGTRSENR